MKIKLNDLVLSLDKLSQLSKTALPIKISYAVSKNLKKIREEMKLVEEKQIEMISKHGGVEMNGGYQIVSPIKEYPDGCINLNYDEELKKFNENIDGYRKDEIELLGSEVEIDLFVIKLSTLPEDVRIPADVLIGLDFLIEEN